MKITVHREHLLNFLNKQHKVYSTLELKTFRGRCRKSLYNLKFFLLYKPMYDTLLLKIETANLLSQTDVTLEDADLLLLHNIHEINK